MTQQEFQSLAIPKMIDTLYEEGVYIGKRRQEQQVWMMFQLEGFYVELCYSRYRYHVCDVRCSASTSVLDPYLKEISLETFVFLP